MAEATHALAHHFDTLEQQHDAATLGMWVFLVTEIMFFGGLFTGYAVYRALHPQAFAAGSRLTDISLGAVNTLVLICSSYTMVLAIRAARMARRDLSVAFLLTTIVLGTIFLGIKFLEYYEKFQEHHVPGAGFFYSGPDPGGVQMFLCLYFGMTALHAIHMMVGIGLVAVMAFYTWKGHFTAEHYAPLEVTGLYWHFVDVVWIFLFPLLYLVDLHK